MPLIVKTEKEARTIVQGLCKFYEVPIIPVRKVSAFEIPGNDAVFYSDDYEIVFRTGIDVSVLVHEFGHYLIRLIHHTQNIEEKVCDDFAFGSMHSIEHLPTSQ